jgi:hypothetical protein
LAGWFDWQDTIVGGNQPFLLARDDGFGSALPFFISPNMRDIGEASRLDIDVRTKSNALPRYDGCGGEQCTTEQLEGIDITLGIDCLSLDNLALAFASNISNNISQTTTQAAQRLTALVNCARGPMSLLFEAINIMDGSQLLVFIPKVKFSITKNRRYISDDFGEITLTGRVLHAGPVAAGYSPWWNETTLRCLPPPPPVVYGSSISFSCDSNDSFQFRLVLQINSNDPSGTYSVIDGAGNPLAFNVNFAGSILNPVPHVQGQLGLGYGTTSNYMVNAAGIESDLKFQTWSLLHLETGTIVSTAVVPSCQLS